jgi:hypothetical protein
MLEKLVIAEVSHTHTHSLLCFSIERSGLKLTGIKLGNLEIIRLKLVDLCMI